MLAAYCLLFTALAGEGGFEPPNGGSKGRCLTAWRLPSIKLKRIRLEFTALKTNHKAADRGWKIED